MPEGETLHNSVLSLAQLSGWLPDTYHNHISNKDNNDVHIGTQGDSWWGQRKGRRQLIRSWIFIGHGSLVLELSVVQINQNISFHVLKIIVSSSRHVEAALVSWLRSHQRARCSPEAQVHWIFCKKHKKSNIITLNHALTINKTYSLITQKAKFEKCKRIGRTRALRWYSSVCLSMCPSVYKCVSHCVGI